MDVPRYIDAVRASGDRLGAAADAAGPDAPVPTCPAWTVQDLLRHVGGVHRWATSYLRTARSGPTSADEEAEFFTEVPPDELTGWYRQGLAALVDALSSADPALDCWTFLPAPSPLAFWARRQAHETSVHCADAEAAAGIASGFPTDLAVDGIDELLNGFIVRPGGRLVAEPPATLGIRPVDDQTGWTVHIGADARTVSAGTACADCTLSGPADDLYLVLWNRRVAENAVTVEGDARVLDQWRAKASIPWS